MRSVADRLQLIEHTQRQWYPQRTGAWLKAVPVAPMLLRAAHPPVGDGTTPRTVLEVFLDSELSWFTNMGPDFDGESAIIGVDGDVLALLWLPRRALAPRPG